MYILCLLRNEDFPSFCMCASLCCEKFRRSKEGSATFRKRDGHCRMVFITFDVCVWEERAEVCLVGLFL